MRVRGVLLLLLSSGVGGGVGGSGGGGSGGSGGVWCVNINQRNTIMLVITTWPH